MFEKPYNAQRDEHSDCCRADEPDFAATVSSSRPQIFRFLLVSLGDPDIAEELTEECFLCAQRNWSRFRGDAKIVTRLMRISINLQKDYWRNKRIQCWRKVRAGSPSAENICDWTPSREMSPEAQAVARVQVALVWKAVQGMRERQRTVFLLRFVEELKLAEIAGMTGLREGTIKAYLVKAVRKLRAELAQT